MTRDEMIRVYHRNSSSWQVLLGIYAVLLGAMAASASMIL
jgi:hypothetical protein